MAKKTKTFSLSVNRTILGKTRSHGSFVSCKPAWLDCFDITNATFSTLSKVFDHKNFYLREKYSAGDITDPYNFGLEKAGAEFRLSSLQSFFRDSNMTETDYLIIEMLSDNGTVVYLVGKSVKQNYLVLNKYNQEDYIRNGVETLTRGNDVLKGISDALSVVLTDASNCIDEDEAKKQIEEAKNMLENFLEI